MACIYKILNKANGKFYIGSTIRPAYIRKYGHFADLRKNKHCNSHLQRAFNKYGEQNFVFEVIEKIDTREQKKVFVVEYQYISFLKPDYNIRITPEVGRENYRHSEETKAKIGKANSKSLVGKKQPQSQIDKRSKKLLGRKRSPEWVKEHSKRMKGKGLGYKFDKETQIKRVAAQYSARVIECYQHGELMASCNFMKEAAIITGMKKSAISNLLIGIAKESRSGWSFKYKEVTNG